MLSELVVRKYNDFPVNEHEVLRYAGCQGAPEDSDMVKLSRECIAEVNKPGMFNYGICYRVLPIIDIDEDCNIDFDIINMKSHDLARLLNGCSSAVFMAATIGPGIDRIIHKYTRINPAKSIFMQAIGAERVETMLDSICQELGNELINIEAVKQIYNDKNITLTPRFSPGYGDLPLGVQPKFLDILDASRKIGITINDSLLMSPSKSVTAIVGVKA